MASWRRVFRIAKTYGINHYRCHSYTPTRAALEAADIEGIYFHVELPLWGAIKREYKRLNDFLLREADGILNFLGNHPSFMMMGLGNELTGDVSLMHEWLDKFRQKDKRHLYSFGSNNNLGWKGPQEGEDYFVTCRVGDGEGYSTHVRTSFAFVDADQGGILNNTRPRTDRNYSEAIARCPRPVVGHETCQFQIYPDYSEIPEYTGVLYPYNFEIFRNRLKENHLEGQQAAFHRATGRFAAECYKADIEYALRTPGFGGFQMLDLQDFPGQGSALVGILNAFMETKNIISPERFNGFCAPVVPLALFNDYCLKNSGTFRARIDIANYEERDWTETVKWTLSADDFDWQREGVLQSRVKQGDVGQVGDIETSLSDIATACRLTLTLTTGKYHNSYHLWVYPDVDENRNAGQNYYSDTLLTSEVVARLEAGENVLLIPSHASVKQQSVGGLFTPDFWNYAMFKGITESAGKEPSPGTLSILTNPTHPLFNLFPTEEHSNWQWWSITRHSRPLILDKTPASYRPLVQVIDNIERNHKLGIFFEFAVGRGKLFVSMCNLQAIASTPEGKQLGRAIRSYIQSDDFAPSTRLTPDQLKELFMTIAGAKDIKGVKNQSDYTH